MAVDKNNLILGYAVFYPVADHIHLESVAVFKKHRQQGIGEALITYCENVADDKGFSSVQLYTNQAMWENFGFYTHLGYKKVGQNTQDDFERIFFRKDIQRAKNET